MTPLSPQPVPQADVRRREVAEEAPAPVHQVAVQRVPSPSVVPRQIDMVGLRLMALQLENDQLRAEVEQLRSA
jgi:hypothetical protein